VLQRTRVGCDLDEGNSRGNPNRRAAGGKEMEREKETKKGVSRLSTESNRVTERRWPRNREEVSGDCCATSKYCTVVVAVVGAVVGA